MSKTVLLRIPVNKLFFLSLKIHMFNLYQTDIHNQKNSIDNELQKLCKIRMCLCHQTEQGELEYVSNCVDTEMIEESES